MMVFYCGMLTPIGKLAPCSTSLQDLAPDLTTEKSPLLMMPPQEVPTPRSAKD